MWNAIAIAEKREGENISRLFKSNLKSQAERECFKWGFLHAEASSSGEWIPDFISNSNLVGCRMRSYKGRNLSISCLGLCGSGVATAIELLELGDELRLQEQRKQCKVASRWNIYDFSVERICIQLQRLFTFSQKLFYDELCIHESYNYENGNDM